ncbi:MAG: hypothetical protein QXN62_08745 [Candidatus Bathyarchaeia archaeon]
MSEASEDVVEYWLSSMDYFTMRNRKVRRNKEIDFLAITLGKPDGRLGSRTHIEVHVGAFSRAIKSRSDRPVWPPSAYAERLVRSKFEDPDVVGEVIKMLGEDYRRVAVWGSYGRTRPDREAREELFKELEKRGITVVRFEELVREVEKKIGTGMHSNPAIRMIQYYKYMQEW